MPPLPAIPGLTEQLAILVVVAVGVLVLFFGGRLLRPATLLAALVVGGAAGLRLAEVEDQTGLLGIPPWSWAVGIPILSAALAFVLYRLCLAVLFAAAAAVAGFLLTVAFMTLGATPAEGPPLIAPATAAMVLDAEVLEHVDSVLQRLSTEIETTVSMASGWVATHSEGVAPSARRFGLVVATICGIVGLALGLAMPDRVARIATVVIGSWLLVAAGTAIWAFLGRNQAPPPPTGVLVAWCVLAGVGAAVQSRQKSKSTDEGG